MIEERTLAVSVPAQVANLPPNPEATYAIALETVDAGFGGAR